MKISYYLPEKLLTYEELSELYPKWSSEKIYKKTGIKTRHMAEKYEFVSDMAKKAAESLIYEYNISKNDIDFMILSTQSPDYEIPTTACILQDKLGLSTQTDALLIKRKLNYWRL